MIFEAMIAQKARSLPEDTATQFTARDRARISEVCRTAAGASVQI
jgi:hypothetical protein